MSEQRFEPRIVGFLCNWCSYRAADLAGSSRISYASNVRIVRLMCSGRVDPTFILHALSEGADGVLIAGCHPGECHYIEQNYKTLRRFHLLQHTLAALGIQKERVQLVWASAAEGPQFARAVDKMVDEIRELGPLNWAANWEEDSSRLALVDQMAQEHSEAVEVPA